MFKDPIFRDQSGKIIGSMQSNPSLGQTTFRDQSGKITSFGNHNSVTGQTNITNPNGKTIFNIFHK